MAAETHRSKSGCFTTVYRQRQKYPSLLCHSHTLTLYFFAPSQQLGLWLLPFGFLVPPQAHVFFVRRWPTTGVLSAAGGAGHPPGLRREAAALQKEIAALEAEMARRGLGPFRQQAGRLSYGASGV
jgi:hypothetical protein